jgi:8-oxo-dGTP pyrophosphatase MutT (NUDIX family)
MATDDLVDLVDADDRVLGTTTRGDVRARNLWHRTVAVLCSNARGQLFVQQRSAHKDLFPEQYDMFTAGCVDAGESYEAAARRELGEELGVVGAPLEPLFKHRYDGPDTRTHTWLYRTHWDGPIVLQPSELAWGGFIELGALLDNPRGWTFVPDGSAQFAEVLRRGLMGGPPKSC